MTQLNTPYPATAYLTGFLRQHEARLGLEVCQADAALELFLRVFSRDGLQRMLAELTPRAAELAGAALPDHGDHGDDGANDDDGDDGALDGAAPDADDPMPPSLAHFLAHGQRSIAPIDALIRFLHGRGPGLAVRL